MNIVQIYAPTADEEAEHFYRLLETTLTEFPSREITIMLGDFNAKIEQTSSVHHARTAVRHYGIGERSDRGNRLLQFDMRELPDHDKHDFPTQHTASISMAFTWRQLSKPNRLHLD